MSLQQTRLGNKLEVIYYCQSHSLNERPWKIVSNSNNLDQYRTSLPVVVVGVVYVCVCGIRCETRQIEAKMRQTERIIYSKKKPINNPSIQRQLTYNFTTTVFLSVMLATSMKRSLDDGFTNVCLFLVDESSEKCSILTRY